MRYVKIENVKPGDRLDQGEFAFLEPGSLSNGQPNPRTWNVVLADGREYTETRSTPARPVKVRVW